MKKNPFFPRKLGFGKEPIFWQIGWTCIKFLLITCSNFILTTCEICQTERVIETEASVIRHDARFLRLLQLPPMLRTFPSAGLEVVKSHNGYAWHFKSQLFRYEPSKLTIAPVICVAFFLSGSGNYGSISQTRSGALKFDVAPSSRRGKKPIFWVYWLVWVKYGLNMV